MNRWVTRDDILDVFLKGKQRGWGFIASKLSPSKNKRTKTAFNASANLSSNWWIIPEVQKRWNSLISGNRNINFEQFLVETHLKDLRDLRMLSLGSGTSGHEIELASSGKFSKITCLDLSDYRMKQASTIAKNKGLKNIEFICSDISNFNFKADFYDIVLFNSSLHHFKNIDNLLKNKIAPCLNQTGKLIINEYVGPTRLQFPKKQITAINEALLIVPKKYRQRYNSVMTKKKFSGSGIIRMVLADPSECVDSENIMPSIHKYFTPVVEKPYGGNIIMNVLKDISHHFINLNDEKKEILKNLFAFEDAYLKNNSSDFIFGIYKKNNSL